jgi:hypothetical protein
MAHLLLARCRVTMSQMQDFTTRIQNWEQDVIGSPEAPEYHGVYLAHDDPSTVVIELRFADSEVADACIAAGHIGRLRDEVITCTASDPGAFDRYDLFYGAGRDGARTVFGERTHYPEG